MRISLPQLLCLFGAMAVAAQGPPTVGYSERLEISYELKRSVITLHEPVALLFKVHNGSEQRAMLDLGVNWVQFFEFTLASSQGRVIQGRGQRSEGLSTQPGRLFIDPGQDYQRELLLNQWFEFDSPGQYILIARLNADINLGGASITPPPATRLALEIKPRNIDRLTKVCSELTSQVLMANGGEAELEPLLRLSYISDPIAVPYLAQILSQHRVNYSLAISGLERIADDAAVEVLLSALNDDFADIADLATRALLRMEDRISNTHLKETVKKRVEQSSARAHRQ